MSACRSLARPLLLLALLAATARAQRPDTSSAPPRAATRTIRIDSGGVLRWADDDGEVSLFGANYTLPSASDFRAAGSLGLDRRKLIDEDMAHFARMGWNALRLSFWGDWENADSAGNLIRNAHLDLLDYLIARARERGIYMLLSPIVTYDAGWPDSMPASAKLPGFSNRFRKSELGTDPAAIAAQVNYLEQILDHVNPYTGLALKDDPAIPFVELINEPTHHSDDVAGSVRYIDALAKAVRSTGSKQIIVYNVSQDFRIAPAIRCSMAQGVTFGWYPSGLNSGHELEGNFLRAVDDYPPMRAHELDGLPRLVYEFESPDLRTGYMYPAMARTFRSVGAQFAAMFAYDMLGTASRNLGWQTHYLNLVYTPRKALSAVIAAEAMRRLPRGKTYGAYPANLRFGDFRVSYESDLGELVTPEAFIYDNDTPTMPPSPERLTRVAGFGSSKLVVYQGRGAYFLDKISEGIWRLEVYPDAVPVRDPFGPPAPDRIVTRAIWRSWPMTIRLPNLQLSFTVQPMVAGNAHVTRAVDGRFDVSPGVYVLAAGGPVDPATLPKYVGGVRMDEFHAPPTDRAPLRVVPLVLPTYTHGEPAVIAARVVAAAPPDSVILAVRRNGWVQRIPLSRGPAYDWSVWTTADTLGDGPVQYAITVVRHDSATTFPGAERRRAWDWNFSGQRWWTTNVIGPRSVLRLFSARDDISRLAFSRIRDGYRNGIYGVPISEVSGAPVLRFELPNVDGYVPPDYTASLVVKDRLRARWSDLPHARSVRVRLRAVGGGATLHLTLMERDGTSWSTSIRADSTWSERDVPRSAFRVSRGVLLPEGYPGEWNYRVGPAEGRGGAGDSLRIRNVERLQFSLHKDDRGAANGRTGVEIESVLLEFEPGPRR